MSYKLDGGWRWCSALAEPCGRCSSASLTAEEGTGDDTHLYTELLESQAFSTSLSVLWTSAISGMFLIPQLYQDQPKLQPLELQLPDGR